MMLNRFSTLWTPQKVTKLLTGLVVTVIFFTGMALIQFSTPDMPDNDGFYHIKLAYLMRTEGLRPEFPWLPLTILNPREFYDHHFLFHVALIPFTLGDLRLGAKWAAVTFSSLAFFSIWWLLRSQRVPFSGLWAFGLLAVSEAFLYRMSITRAQSLSLAVLAWGLHWMLTRRYALLIPLGFVYVWLYNAFPLLTALAFFYCAAVWISERKLEIRPVLFSALGIALGLIINLYFPYNLIFIFHHLLPKLSDATSVSVGNEWFPYSTLQLLKNSGAALFAFAAGALGLGLNERRMDTRTAASFFAALLFGLMLFQARRFIEYFPAFALIFAALAWSPLLEGLSNSDSIFRPAFLKRVSPKNLSALLLAVVLIPAMWITLKDAVESIRGAKPYQLYQGAASWLAENTPSGSRVFQTDWDDFPRLFFYNTHNTYLVGLDPTYLQIYDPDLYDLWVRITDGEIEQPSGIIRAQFGSQFVMTDLAHKNFLKRAGEDAGLREVYRDDEAVIFEVIEP